MTATSHARHLHLVRHGEVENPDHVVYADLDGFGLSARGAAQAEAASALLGTANIGLIVSSPLDRARQTAARIAAPHREAPLTTDDRLTEWLLGTRWAGTVWGDLPEQFPGELEAYLAHPDDLPFSPESLSDVAIRFAAAAEAAFDTASNGDVIVVSHQDPVQAGRLRLTGKPFEDFHGTKPGHASVITLTRGPEPGGQWRQVAWWEPDQGPAFPPVSE